MNTTMNNTMNDSICENCGSAVDTLVEVTVNGETMMVCEDCAEAMGFVQCSECGEWISEDESYTTYDGDVICESCYDDGFFTCPDCGEIYRTEDAVRVNPDTSHEDYVCQDCADRNYVQCDHCGEYFDTHYLWAEDDHRAICENCCDYYVVCEECGTIMHIDDALYSESYGGYLCEDCYEEEEDNEVVHSYGYHPTPEFQYTENDDHDSLLFGVELEIDKGDDRNDAAEDLDGLGLPMYMKTDGSLGCDGIEIVTHPCTLDFHENAFNWNEIARVALDHDYRSHDTDTCGLHVHVGRMQMGATARDRHMTAGKLVYLMAAIEDKIVPFTRRSANKLNHWASIAHPAESANIDAMTEEEAVEAAIKETLYTRYHAVNLMNNNTVEFRLFRGTLKRNTLIASIQLVNNMVKYAMSHSVKECTTATFADVVSYEEHAELRAYIQARGI